jgi:hypothetical protein
MITEETFEFYNSRLTADIIPNKKLSPSQRDAIKTYGSQAEALMKNRDLAMFIHHFKFSINDAMANIRSHTAEANAERVALANQLSGIDGFINTLKSAVYKKNVMLKAETAGQTDNQS